MSSTVTLRDVESNYDRHLGCWHYKLNFIVDGNRTVTVEGRCASRSEMRSDIKEFKELLGCSK